MCFLFLLLIGDDEVDCSREGGLLSFNAGSSFNGLRTTYGLEIE